MIDLEYLEEFKLEAQKYNQYKDRVKKYIDSRYQISTKSPVSCYSIRVGFQMVIADIPQSVVAYWLQEWGYRVEPSKVDNSRNHNAYLQLKPLITEIFKGDGIDREPVKMSPKKKKGIVVW